MPARRILLTIVILTIGTWLGCAAGGFEVATPQGKSVKYPSALSDDGKRRQAVNDYWAAFLKERNLPETALELEPVTGTIRSLPASLAGRIRITGKDETLSPLEAREALRNFMDRHAMLFFGEAGGNVTPHKLLSLTSFSEDGKFYRASWTQANYPFEIVNGYGVLSIAISRQGAILQAGSRLIPAVGLPSEPVVTGRQLIERMTGRVFTYSTIAGRPESYRVESATAVHVGKAVVFPMLEGTALEIRLAIPVEIGNGLTWTVFIDAVDGRELAVRQNFQS